MEALFSEELFYIFEDIIDIEDENESLVSDSNSETVINIQPMNAKSLSLGELQQECIKRGLQFSGFADEVRSLQEAFNKENEEYIEQKRREHVEERRKQAETALARLKRNHWRLAQVQLPVWPSSGWQVSGTSSRAGSIEALEAQRRG